MTLATFRNAYAVVFFFLKFQIVSVSHIPQTSDLKFSLRWVWTATSFFPVPKILRLTRRYREEKVSTIPFRPRRVVISDHKKRDNKNYSALKVKLYRSPHSCHLAGVSGETFDKTLSGNLDRIRQILLNLLKNSWGSQTGVHNELHPLFIQT